MNNWEHGGPTHTDFASKTLVKITSGRFRNQFGLVFGSDNSEGKTRNPNMYEWPDWPGYTYDTDGDMFIVRILVSGRTLYYPVPGRFLEKQRMDIEDNKEKRKLLLNSIQLPSFESDQIVQIKWRNSPKLRDKYGYYRGQIIGGGSWKSHVEVFFDSGETSMYQEIPTELLIPLDGRAPEYMMNFYAPSTTTSTYFPPAPAPTTTTTIPYTQPIGQILFVTHGDASTTGKFQLPNNVELVHFETSSDSISFITADLIINKLPQTIPGNRFVPKEYSLPPGKWVGHPSLTPEDGRFRTNVFLPNSQVDNLGLVPFDPNPLVHSLIGFYDPSQAYLDFQTILGGFAQNPPTTGKNDTATNEFITGLQQMQHTTLQTLVTFISNKVRVSNPGQVVRLLLICCKIGEDMSRINQIMEPYHNENLQGGKRRRAKKGRKQTRRRGYSHNRLSRTRNRSRRN
jgi:hypothetical protein